MGRLTSGLLRLVAFLALPSAGWGQIKLDEQVLFFPTCGHLSTEGDGWVVPIHGWIFEPEDDSLKRAASLELYRRFFGREWSDVERDRFRSRAWMFLVDNERGKRVRVNIGGKQHAVGISEPNGHFRGVFTSNGHQEALASGGSAPWLSFRAVTPQGDDRVFEGAVQLLEPVGVSVISDLDDTVKVSKVGELRELLANTFLRPFQPVPGMAETYRTWVDAGWSIHYVTASPWQLYPVVDEFLREEGFPWGSMHMKLVRWKDLSVANLLTPSAETKRASIEQLMDTYPKRRFVLVGDSGEGDPELYAGFARSRPEQVEGIFIRDVGHGAEAERMGIAFQGVPEDRWRVFRDGRELAAAAPVQDGK